MSTYSNKDEAYSYIWDLLNPNFIDTDYLLNKSTKNVFSIRCGSNEYPKDHLSRCLRYI